LLFSSAAMSGDAARQNGQLTSYLDWHAMVGDGLAVVGLDRVIAFVGLRGKGRSEKHGNGEKARDDGHENSLPGTDSSSCRSRGSIANHECVTAMRAKGRQAASG
jgi:hypothetical protein